ncbi:hypothetical protein K1T71_013100 [Dendrolimus kikuchii]|uniref:Uncharacterized protein n=1 Tax=Dendrolimus kikuchii TaxID=765133 RepID=A0ACC1CJ36_9NEOP|nr:hypothetical protein K1T71_013100 [Dendrolimus kikuchii]
MFDYKYLSNDHLAGLKKYKYSAIDTSPLSNYVMHPTWNTITKIVPKWIAPNVITFAGFLCMVITVLFLTLYDYEFYGAGGRPETDYKGLYEIPNWLYTTCGVLIFLAYNLDGIDGKQARRIGISGPLGELFDHGLDSYIVFLIPFAVISIFGRDPEYSVSCFRGFLVVVSVVVNFYVSHCEKYNTGTLYLPWGYDVSMWVSSILFIAAGYNGPEVFKVRLLRGATFIQIFETVIHLVGLLTTLPVSIYNVYLYYNTNKGPKYSILASIRPIWSLLLVTVLTIVWALKSENNIIDYDPRMFIFLYGTFFSNIASRLIISEMTQQKCEVVCWMFWPLLAGVITSLYQPSLERSVLYTLSACAFLAHIHYGVCVVRQICNYLNISCFTVPKDKRK